MKNKLATALITAVIISYTSHYNNNNNNNYYYFVTQLTCLKLNCLSKAEYIFICLFQVQ